MARRKKRTAHDALRTQWQLTSDERPPLTFIGVQTRVYGYGTVLDDIFAIVRFIHLRGKAPRIVQEAVPRIFTPSYLLIVLGWLSTIRHELPTHVAQSAGALTPGGASFQYLTWASQYAWQHERAAQYTRQHEERRLLAA